MQKIFLPATQIILLVLWFTVAPGLPTWLVLLPLIIWGSVVAFAGTVLLGAFIIARE